MECPKCNGPVVSRQDGDDVCTKCGHDEYSETVSNYGPSKPPCPTCKGKRMVLRDYCVCGCGKAFRILMEQIYENFDFIPCPTCQPKPAQAETCSECGGLKVVCFARFPRLCPAGYGSFRCYGGALLQRLFAQ